MRSVITLSLFALAGCAGYEYGDVTNTVLTTQAEYCESADPYQRAIRMVLLQRAGLDLPDDGACADILELINGRVSE